MVARTLVSFHAHPDDEALLTGGTIAKAVAAGHRVVLVVATDGEAGLAAAAAAGHDLGARRRDEVHAAARALGVQRVELLGLPDSGWHTTPAADAFSRRDPGRLAERLAALLRAERADVLTTYDAAGGYGHPDHRQVHVVGALAARLAGTPRVLEATLPRERLHRLVRLAARVPGLLDVSDPAQFATAFSPVADIGYRIDVRRQLAAKRAAMAAHASQATSDLGPRTLDLLLRLPRPMFSLAAGTEWFVEPGSVARRRDVFADLPA